MHSHALILAALSASALASMSLTAYDPSDYNCVGRPIGNDIGLSGSDCKLYQPEKLDAYILAVFVPGRDDEVSYNINIFSDTNCMDQIGTIEQNSTTTNEGGYENCYSMDFIAAGPWGSAMAGDPYQYNNEKTGS
ncbi:MAG: hypothetical protein ALECFALPRED_007020 [Alectoria fallacina]|uniref:Uncharacterized protein n=1 Tax=Alectoria fallacina TaxID=1903189 RepID=A0A8H3G9B5_9LECA|nr:MAG: hypothetical protein ALECFALPRED_007020 [Alectoria fallacina]